MLSINTNIASMFSSRNIYSASQAAQTSLQRLSSGERINSAKDDAAGLMISKGLETEIKGLNIARRNALDGVAMMQVAEGGLGSIQDGLIRLSELALLSASDTSSDDVRTGYQKEADSIVADIQRISENTKYGDIDLLGTGATAKTLQIGTTASSTMDSGIHADGLADFASGTALDDILDGTFDISTQTAASSLVGTVDGAIDKVSEMRGVFGGTINALEGIADRNSANSINLSEARSRIVDTDVATEMANLAAAQLKQQVGVAMLGQANASSQMILSLL